jgi:hypothetical protein
LRITEEGRLKDACKKLFEANGFYYRSVTVGYVPGRTNPSAGIPDCVVMKAGVVAWVEYKTPKGKLSKEQETFIFEWTAHGGLVFVVRSLEECQEVIRKLGLLIRGNQHPVDKRSP